MGGGSFVLSESESSPSISALQTALTPVSFCYSTDQVALDNEIHELESLFVCFCSTLPRCNRQSQHRHGTISEWEYASLLTIFRQYG